MYAKETFGARKLVSKTLAGCINEGTIPVSELISDITNMRFGIDEPISMLYHPDSLSSTNVKLVLSVDAV